MAKRKYKTEEIIQHLRTMEIEQAKGSTMEQITRKIGAIYSYFSKEKLNIFYL